MYGHYSKMQLYAIGMARAIEFLNANDLPLPKFYTYEEAQDAWDYASTAKESETNAALKLLQKVMDGPLLGTKTGLYSHHHIFVNVPVTALPAHVPGNRKWSWPGYKVDRTAIGVVAHELGHYIEHILQEAGRLNYVSHGEKWRRLIAASKKSVSGYQKDVPSEAWAESMRLFILNPDLLKMGMRDRYDFITDDALLVPHERRKWHEVIGNGNYVMAAERWIAA